MRRAFIAMIVAWISGCASPPDFGCSQLSDCPLDRACIRSVPGGVCAGLVCQPDEELVRPGWDHVPAALCLARCSGSANCPSGWVCDFVDADRVCIPRCDRMPSTFCRGYRCLSDGICNGFCVDDSDCDAISRCRSQECVPR